MGGYGIVTVVVDLNFLWRVATEREDKTLKVNTTAGSTYHRTLFRLLFPGCMQKKKLLMTFGTTYVISKNVREKTYF
jgi:hypothetical protein